MNYMMTGGSATAESRSGCPDHPEKVLNLIHKFK